MERDELVSQLHEVQEKSEKDCLAPYWYLDIDKVADFILAREAELRKKWDMELSAELRDPNGTIWECYDKLRKEHEAFKANHETLVSSLRYMKDKEIEELRAEVARLKEKSMALPIQYTHEVNGSMTLSTRPTTNKGVPNG